MATSKLLGETGPELGFGTVVRDQASDNMAVVRTWWTVLESEWRAALAEPATPDARGPALVDPSLRAAIAPFEQFDATIDDLFAFGERVVIAISLRGRIAGRDTAAREAWVCLLDEGAVLEVRQYRSVQEALLTLAGPAGEQPILAARL
jgi:hypothetical protein